MITIKDIHLSLEHKKVPQAWIDRKEKISNDYQKLQNLLSEPVPPRIYGVNTLVGHMDKVLLPREKMQKFQLELIENHKIGSAPYMNAFTSLSIGLMKISQISNGGTAVSPALYHHLLDTIFDPDFNPEIPVSGSYSSGDVIPGAHWASSLAEILERKYHYKLQPKEGMSLINGSFIHAGYMLSLYKKINNCWNIFVHNSMENAVLITANKSNFTDLIKPGGLSPAISKINQKIVSLLDGHEKKAYHQDPVSIRSFTQVLISFEDAILEYKRVVEDELNSRSDNPLVLSEASIPLSQSSFLSPLLTVTSGKLIEVLLMGMWVMERRTHHLLSGNAEDIPLNGTSETNPLGFIQVPKLMTGILEEARMQGARRSFASGSSTSYGIEDFWSHGVNTAKSLEQILHQFISIASIESILNSVLWETFLKKDTPFRLMELSEHKSFGNKVAALEQKLLYDTDLPFNGSIDHVLF